VATRNLYTILSSAFETALESAGWPPALGSPSGTLAAASEDLRHVLCELAGYITEVQKSSEPHAFRVVDDPAQQQVREAASGEALTSTVATATFSPSPATVILLASPYFLILSIRLLLFLFLMLPLYLIIINNTRHHHHLIIMIITSPLSHQHQHQHQHHHITFTPT